MFIGNLDLSSRLNPFSEVAGSFDRSTVQRVANLALPLICLYRPAAVLVTLGSSLNKTICILTEIPEHYRKGGVLSVAYDLNRIAITISMLAFAVYFPVPAMVVGDTTQLTSEIYKLLAALWKCDLGEGINSSFQILRSFIHINTSIFSNQIGLRAFSLLLDAIVELEKAVKEYKENRLPEAFVNLLLASFRLYAVTSHVKEMQKEESNQNPSKVEPKKQVAPQEKKQTLREVIADLVKQNGSISDMEANEITSSTWKDLKLEILQLWKELKTNFLKESNDKIIGGFSSYSTYKNLQFENENFRRISLNKTIFEGCTFLNCNFDESSFCGSKFSNCLFFGSNARKSVFFNNTFENTLFILCDFERSCFNNSRFFFSYFIGTNFYESNFFGATADSSSLLVFNELTDCILAKGLFQSKSNTPNKITRPVIVQPWCFSAYGQYAATQQRAIESDYKCIVMKIDYSSPEVSSEKLTKEVKAHLAALNNKIPKGFLSLPDAILARAKPGSEMDKIIQIAMESASYADGILLPGGEDIPPELYGAKRESYTYSGDDYQRSFLEAALLSISNHHKVPLMGICRGAQMGNVFFGGTLKQHVHNQYATQLLEIVDKDILDRFGLSNPFVGESMHHQACDRIGENLQVFLQYQNVPKAWFYPNGHMFFTQFHPEFYHGLISVYGENKAFFDYFLTLVAFQAKSKTEEESRSSLG